MAWLIDCVAGGGGGGSSSSSSNMIIPLSSLYRGTGTVLYFVLRGMFGLGGGAGALGTAAGCVGGGGSSSLSRISIISAGAGAVEGGARGRLGPIHTISAARTPSGCPSFLPAPDDSPSGLPVRFVDLRLACALCRGVTPSAKFVRGSRRPEADGLPALACLSAGRLTCELVLGCVLVLASMPVSIVTLLCRRASRAASELNIAERGKAGVGAGTWEDGPARVVSVGCRPSRETRGFATAGPFWGSTMRLFLFFLGRSSSSSSLPESKRRAFAGEGDMSAVWEYE